MDFNEYFLSKIQFTSSNSPYKLYQNFVLIKSVLIDNNSKLLLKTNFFSYKYSISTDLKGIFNLIIKINEDNIEIIKYDQNNFSCVYAGHISLIFNIDKLIRNTKLKQLQNKLHKQKISFDYNKQKQL